MAQALTGRERQTAQQRGRRLAYVTIGYNVLEAVVSIIAAVLAGSTALLGFGVDSLIESSSGGAALWRLQTGQDLEQEEARERIALRLVGGSLLLLAGYVAWEATWALLRREVPDPSAVGIGIAALSLVVMPVLARAKRRVARALHSGALTADSKQTSICAWLSAILLAGLVLNALLGWWWADPAAALVMVPLIGWEGVEALRGRACEDCAP